jgi:hypothetical protein
MLKAEETAPDFDLPSHNGERVRLSDFRGKKNVVLFFYAKDDTPGCTEEACSFRDSYGGFTTCDTAVLGISSDSGGSHARFADKIHCRSRCLRMKVAPRAAHIRSRVRSASFRAALLLSWIRTALFEPASPHSSSRRNMFGLRLRRFRVTA